MNVLTAVPREEPDGVGTRLRRRALAMLACVVAAGFTVLMLCGLAIALAWDTPYRTVVIAGLALAFLAAAIVTGEVARAESRSIPQPGDGHGTTGHFPRSATMRALTNGGAMSALALAGVAVLATRPGVASRVSRAVPVVDLLRQLGLPGAR